MDDQKRNDSLCFMLINSQKRFIFDVALFILVLLIASIEKYCLIKNHTNNYYLGRTLFLSNLFIQYFYIN